MEEIIDKIWGMLAFYGIRIITAILILVIGRWISMALRNFLKRLMTKSKVDETVVSFVGNLSYAAMLVVVVIAALNQLGIQTASFIAILGAAGLAIGLALQGSLSNFAAGVLMVMFRPFKVGDFIEAGGASGTVEEIEIFTTKLASPDNKTVIIPNAQVMSGNIINYTTKGTRRVDMVFGIGYDDDIDKARSIIKGIIEQDERILKDPEPRIFVSELADSSVNFTVRAWSKASDYWNVFFDTTETVKKRFDAEGVSIPFPQRDVHIYEHK